MSFEIFLLLSEHQAEIGSGYVTPQKLTTNCCNVIFFYVHNFCKLCLNHLFANNCHRSVPKFMASLSQSKDYNKRTFLVKVKFENKTLVVCAILYITQILKCSTRMPWNSIK